VDARPGDGAKESAMSFHIGQQVVCVNGKFSDDIEWRRTVRAFPQLHSVYTIREIIEDPPLVGFCFYELPNERHQFRSGHHEPAFNSRNFRPVKRTSIEALEKLLAPTDPVGAD
jgi:hypothetical protein